MATSRPVLLCPAIVAMTTHRPGPGARWLRVLAAIVAIWTLAPTGPWLWRQAAAALGRSAEAVVLSLLGAIALMLLLHAFRRHPPGGLALVGFAGVVAIYVAAILRVPLTPAEKLHFLYYGSLAWLAEDAARTISRDRLAVAIAIVLTALVGLGDEAIQYVLPTRHFEWKDVWLNASSGALALAARHLLASPRR